MKADTKAVIKAGFQRGVLSGVVGFAMGVIFHGVTSEPAGTFLGIPYGHAVRYLPLTIASFGLVGAVVGGLIGAFVKHQEHKSNNRLFAQKTSYNGND